MDALRLRDAQDFISAMLILSVTRHPIIEPETGTKQNWSLDGSAESKPDLSARK
jgi:hypothetical protein